MPTFTLPSPHRFRPPVALNSEVSGEDVMFAGALSISSGDWRTVRGADAAEQSVRREAMANVGALLRRPDWGMGITQGFLRNLTQSVTENIVTRVRKQMRANPRVGRFISADIARLPTGLGIQLSISYEPVGVKRPRTVVLKGDR